MLSDLVARNAITFGAYEKLFALTSSTRICLCRLALPYQPSDCRAAKTSSAPSEESPASSISADPEFALCWDAECDEISMPPHLLHDMRRLDRLFDPQGQDDMCPFSRRIFL